MNGIVIAKEQVETKIKNINNRGIKKIAKKQIEKTDFPEVVSLDISTLKKVVIDSSFVEPKVSLPTEGVPTNESIPDVNELYGIKIVDRKKSEDELKIEEELWEEERRLYKTDKVLTILQWVTFGVLVIIIVVAVYLGLQLFNII